MWDFVKKLWKKEDKQTNSEYVIEIKDKNTYSDEIATHNKEEEKITELLSDNDEDSSFDSEEDADENNEPFAFYFLFSDSFKFDSNKLRKRLEKFEDVKVKINDLLEWEETNKVFAYVTIGKEKFKLVGFDMKIPSDLASCTINLSNNRGIVNDEIKNHKYHIIAFYEGNSRDTNEVFNAYARIAYAFIEDNLVAMVNGYCWNIIKPETFINMFANEEDKHLSNTPAINIWRNIVEIPYKNSVWYATKGNNLYGVPEFAYKGSKSDYEKVIDIFERIFYYAYSTKAKFDTGSTFELSKDTTAVFKDLYENEKKLEGKFFKTLVIEIENKEII